MTLTDRYVVKFTNSFLQRRSIRTGTVPIISILSQKFQFFKNYRSEDLSISRQFQVQFQFVFEHARCLPGPLVQFRPCSEPCPPLFGQTFKPEVRAVTKVIEINFRSIYSINSHKTVSFQIAKFDMERLILIFLESGLEWTINGGESGRSPESGLFCRPLSVFWSFFFVS